MKTPTFGVTVATLAALAAPVAASAQDRNTNDDVYSAAQAGRGQMLYAQNCASCHMPNLAGGAGPPLAGRKWLAIWSDQPVSDLVDRIQTSMPMNRPGSLSRKQVADITAYIFKVNGYAAGAKDLPADPAPLKQINIAVPKAK